MIANSTVYGYIIVSRRWLPELLGIGAIDIEELQEAMIAMVRRPHSWRIYTCVRLKQYLVTIHPT